MALTAAQIAKLNNMCKGAYDGTLGTTLAAVEDVSAKILGGTYTADADDQSAGTVSIDRVS